MDITYGQDHPGKSRIVEENRAVIPSCSGLKPLSPTSSPGLSRPPTYIHTSALHALTHIDGFTPPFYDDLGWTMFVLNLGRYRRDARVEHLSNDFETLAPIGVNDPAYLCHQAWEKHTVVLLQHNRQPLERTLEAA